MTGIALGRLWDTHPKMALVLHLLLTVYLGVLDAWAFFSGNTGGGVVIAIGIVLMAVTLVTFARMAAQNDWQPEDYPRQLASPRAAWTNTQAPGRILWLLFGVVFVLALVLLLSRSVIGVGLILVAFVLAVIAMRTD